MKLQRTGTMKPANKCRSKMLWAALTFICILIVILYVQKFVLVPRYHIPEEERAIAELIEERGGTYRVDFHSIKPIEDVDLRSAVLDDADWLTILRLEHLKIISVGTEPVGEEVSEAIIAKRSIKWIFLDCDNPPFLDKHFEALVRKGIAQHSK